jgi:serine/threonine protein kinase
MTPEQWDAIDRIWHAVLARPEHERPAALTELCAGDDALRHDVESLLGHLARASAAGFGGAPGGAARASLIGRRIGPYAVQTLLGAGGMGEVYQAHDATLGRDVAIKILSDVWLTSPERRARFDREAQLLASLNHPNIGAIYGVHESDGIRALVLELIDGETLAERIARHATTSRPSRGLPLADVVQIAGQMAEAIEAAHDRGIIHRDLKPANIKLKGAWGPTPTRLADGRLVPTRPATDIGACTVKVLDFGLAKAVGAAGSGSDVADALDATIDGALLGTAAYMSPEQARGRPVDTRTDIWAFGCVVYEMLTGAKAFGGDGLAEVLANVIKGEPDWRALPAETPPALRQCLRRCLQKDARQRFHHIADVRLAMEDAFDAAASEGRSSTRRGPPAMRVVYVGWAATTLVAVAAIAVAVVVGRNAAGSRGNAPPSATPPVLYSPRIGGGGTATAATIQEAIDQVARGGTVTLLPGTYAEAVTIKKGLTLQATGERSGAVILAPSGSPESVVEIETTEPVTLRGLTLHVSGANGIRGSGAVNLTVERSVVLAVNPPNGRSHLIRVENDTTPAGPRARAVIRESVLDGTITKLPPRVARPQSLAVRLVGDVDGVIERSTIRRTGGICIVVHTRTDLTGVTNVDILDNDIDECHPVDRVGAILVGAPSVLTLSPEQTITATGTVNIIGNTFRNSSEDCLTSAIAFDTFSGRIERNRIVNFIQPCAVPTTRNLPAAIWLGLRGNFRLPPVAPAVRFNDIVGNAHAGLRLAPNYALKVDASCNFWGSEGGPSGAGPGAGDILLVGQDAIAPVVLPFASAPIARSKNGGC